ncbi:MAG TPA: gluconate 2-dehydrogenase subunit 3 family protein [Steroidobacteraceae bacterium]
MDRRTTIKWVLAAGAAWPVLANRATADNSPVASRGYGTDPKLTVDYHPGELWPLTFTAAQRALAGILSDLIIPADNQSPSASSVGVVEFIDEWISAPYPKFQRDRMIVLGGFAWLDAEGVRRFGKEFSQLESGKQRMICDDICDPSRASAERSDAARFFALYRDLTAGGFYSTPVGRKDLEYIGNVPLAKFDGPPIELLKVLGLE